MIEALTPFAALLFAVSVSQPPVNTAQPVAPPSVAAANASLRTAGKSKTAVPVGKNAAIKRAKTRSAATAAAKSATTGAVVGMPAMKSNKKPARQ